MTNLTKVSDTINAKKFNHFEIMEKLWEFEKALRYLDVDAKVALLIYEDALRKIKNKTEYFTFYKTIHLIGDIITNKNR